MITTTAHPRYNVLSSVGVDVPFSGTADEILAAARLDWGLRKVALRTEGGKQIRSHIALERDDTGDVLSVVGTSYEVIENRSMISTLTQLVDDGSATFQQAGATHGGRRVFALMDIPAEWQITDDPHSVHLLASTTHDGTGAMKIRPVMERLHCHNQISSLFWRKAEQRSVSIRHTASADRKIAGLREALGMALAATEEYAVIADQMLHTSVSEGDVEKFLADLFPLPEHLTKPETARQEASAQRLLDKRDEVAAVYLNGTQQSGLRGTAFGLFQAAVDWSDWSSPTRGGQEQVRRAERVVSGTDLAFKQQAYDLSHALVG